MSCRHDLANGNCRRCYPGGGTADPGPEEDYGPNLEGPGAVTREEHAARLAAVIPSVVMLPSPDRQEPGHDYFCGCGTRLDRADLKCSACASRLGPRKAGKLTFDEMLASVLAMEDAAIEDLIFGRDENYRELLLPNFGFSKLPEKERPVARAFAAMAATFAELPPSVERTQALLRLADSLRFALSSLRGEES